MARTRCQFTQATMKRLLKAAAAAGVAVRIEIEGNKIVVLPAGEKPPEPSSTPDKEIIL